MYKPNKIKEEKNVNHVGAILIARKSQRNTITNVGADAPVCPNAKKEYPNNVEVGLDQPGSVKTDPYKIHAITLVALVITVIILIILAGVSLNLALGQNGIFQKSKQAVDKYKDESQKEQNTLENIYQDMQKFEDESKSKTVTAQMIAENPKEYYGKKVVNYKANEDDKCIYRIFYVDKNNDFKDGEYTIYLKADVSEEVTLSTEYDEGKTKVKEMNPEWAKLNRDSESWYDCEKAAAWLCDPSKWTKYLDEDNELVNYAIGGPSLDMYVASYNQAFDSIEGSYVFRPDEDDWGYYIYYNGPEGSDSTTDSPKNSLDCIMYNEMYCSSDSSMYEGWWLSSPSADWAKEIFGVDLKEARLWGMYEYQSDQLGICPIVSLKPEFILEIE